MDCVQWLLGHGCVSLGRVVILNIIHSLINSFTLHSCGETGISEETERETHGPGHCPFDPSGSSETIEAQAWPPAAAE